MCGRYWLVTPADVLASRFRVRGERVPLLPRWNAAPGQDLPVVRFDAADGRPRPRADALGPRSRPGPSGPRTPGGRSTRAPRPPEAKPSFKEPLRRSRALVPADGFFEWKKGDRGREPVAFRLKSRRPFAFAGIFDAWTPRSGPPLRTFAILTTRPNGLVAPVHDRMPLILAPDDEERWLDPGIRGPRGAWREALAPPDEGAMEAFPVSRRVNTPANDDASLLDPPGPEVPPAPKTLAASEAQRDLWENEDDDGDGEGGGHAP